MNGPEPNVTVVIPTYQRHGRLRDCLTSLAAQANAPSFEIIVTVDGPDTGERLIAGSSEWDVPVQVLDGERLGPAAARNRAIEAAAAPVLLLLNDDIVAAPDLVAVHAAGQASSRDTTLIVGDSPWATTASDTLFDCMVYETSTVFFYDTMYKAADSASRDWGFRHAWSLNLSLPTEAARSVRGFEVGMARPVYEDLEFAHRITKSGAPVRYEAAARVIHHHRYTPEKLLRRDGVLGHQAVRLAELNPGCAAAMFGRDVCEAREADHAAWFVATQMSTARRAVDMLEEAATSPVAAIRDDPCTMVRALYEVSLHARRVCWFAGLKAAHDGLEATDAEHWVDQFLEQTKVAAVA